MVGAGYSQTAASGECQYCPYKSGNDYLAGVNLDGSIVGGRDIGISILFTVAFFFIVFGAMYLRSKPKKKSKA